MAMSDLDRYLVLWAKAQQHAECVHRGVGKPSARAYSRRWLRQHGFGQVFLGEPLDDSGPAIGPAAEHLVGAMSPDGASRQGVPAAQAVGAGQDHRRAGRVARPADTERQTITITTRTTTTVTTKITVSGAGA
jgi:hypothetical protein